MPARVFKTVDQSLLALALSETFSHSDISAYEIGLGLNTDVPGVNKTSRATRILRFIWSEVETDALVLGLLDALYVTFPYADSAVGSPTYRELSSRVLEPRGVTRTDDGFTFVDSALRNDHDTAVPVAPTVQPSPAQSFIFPTVPLIPDSALVRSDGPEQDPRRVFIVHGRDQRPVAVIRQFLMFAGLQTLTWTDARSLTRDPQPHTFDIVKAGIERAAAVIVLFSPDELARLRPELASDEDDHDGQEAGQARPNVLLEAGMAFALSRTKTIFVQSGATREISDLSGFNWVTLDGSWDSRDDLIRRLIDAGAAVVRQSDNLMDPMAGAFEVDPWE